MAKKKEVIQISEPESLNPQSPAEFSLRGWLFYAKKDYSRAIDDYNKSLELDPTNIDTLYALGLAYKAQGDATKSVQIFSRLIPLLDTVDDKMRASLLRRLANGHINQVKTGEWDLEKQTWQGFH